MKLTFLKNSLSAFAFTIAIIASFAFSNTQNDVDIILEGYVKSSLSCDYIGNVSDQCRLGGGLVCTFNSQTVYKKANGSGTSCLIELKRVL